MKTQTKLTALPKEIPKKRKLVINISQEVFDHIAKHSRPLVDTPDSALRRLFGLAEKTPHGKDQ